MHAVQALRTTSQKPQAIAPRWRQRGLGLLLTLALIFSEPTRLSADVFFLRNRDEPLIGRLKEQDETNWVIQLATPQAGVSELSIPAEEIDFHITTVSDTRLQRLEPGNWTDYRDYAEELAAWTRDPEAEELAIRLFLIVAYQANGGGRQAAFRHLIRLARTAEEERRFRTLAFQEASLPDPRILQQPNTVKSDSLAAEDRERLLELIRLARRGYGKQALEMTDHPQVKRAYEAIAHVMSLREFRQATYEAEVSPEVLHKWITLELVLMSTGQNAATTEAPPLLSPGWSQLVARSVSEPFQPVSWFNVTEFDPRQCRYEDGRWQVP